MATRAPRASILLPAFVLHRHDWSESSLILEVFTREQGRVTVVAKGAKRPYSQLRSVLLPFQRIQVGLGKPPKRTESEPVDGAQPELQTLRSAEWVGGHAMLTGAPLFSGFYLNELLMRLLARQDPHPRLFDAYAQTLPVLAAGDDMLTEAALRAFELVLLREVGVLPTLSVVTLDPRPVRPAGQYRLQAESGVVPDDGDPTHASLPALTGERLMALQAGLDDGRLAPLQEACLPALAALKGVLRPLLHYHLGQTPLRTRQVMRGVHTLGA